MSETVRYYEALLESDYATWSSSCWTVMVGDIAATDVSPLLGDNFEVLPMTSFQDLVDLSSAEGRFDTWRSGLAWMIQLDKGVALLEPNGFGASLPVTFIKLAAVANVAATLYWNDAIARNEISLGRGGSIDTAGLYYWDPEDPHPLLASHLDGHDTATGFAGGLAIVEAATGVRLTMEILEHSHPVAVFDLPQ